MDTWTGQKHTHVHRVGGVKKGNSVDRGMQKSSEIRIENRFREDEEIVWEYLREIN